MTVRDIVTEDLVVVSSSATPAEVQSLLDAQDFDLVGVDSSGDGVADRVVTRRDLVDAASVWRASHPLPVENVVEKSMSLGSLLTLLESRPHVFVLDEYRVRHIVTHADLARPAVGLVFLAYLLVLERVLLALAVRRIGTSWFDSLTADQQRAAMELYSRKRRQNTGLGLESCLYFDGVNELALEAPGLLRDLGTSAKKYRAMRQRLEGMRNDLAHGGTVLDRKRPPEAVLADFRELRRLTEAASSLAAQSRGLDELYVRTRLTAEDGTPLTGPDAVQTLPLDEPIAVVTAWNPASHTRPREENERAQNLLIEAIESHSRPWLKVTGASPDGSWVEPSIAIGGVERNEAVALGKDYGQRAIFQLTRDELIVVPVAEAAQELRRNRFT